MHPLSSSCSLCPLLIFFRPPHSFSLCLTPPRRFALFITLIFLTRFASLLPHTQVGDLAPFLPLLKDITGLSRLELWGTELREVVEPFGAIFLVLSFTLDVVVLMIPVYRAWHGAASCGRWDGYCLLFMGFLTSCSQFLSFGVLVAVLAMYYSY